MITCVVEYVIDAAKIDAFEEFARRWIELVNRHGGTHHGYFLPSEGSSDKALELFSFGAMPTPDSVRQENAESDACSSVIGSGKNFAPICIC